MGKTGNYITNLIHAIDEHEPMIDVKYEIDDAVPRTQYYPGDPVKIHIYEVMCYGSDIGDDLPDWYIEDLERHILAMDKNDTIDH